VESIKAGLFRPLCDVERGGQQQYTDVEEHDGHRSSLMDDEQASCNNTLFSADALDKQNGC
jgi:hypothetical protein